MTDTTGPLWDSYSTVTRCSFEEVESCRYNSGSVYIYIRSKTVTGSFQSTRGQIQNINIEIKSPRPNYRRNHQRKKESKLDSFEDLEEHWSNGYRTRSLFRTHVCMCVSVSMFMCFFVSCCMTP
jgi:hypothetical protein